MKNIIIILLFSLIYISCGPKNLAKDFTKFKTGSFLYYYKGEQRKDDITFSINRNDSIQTETNSKSGKTSTYKIKWTDSSKYELYFLKSTDNLSDSIIKRKQAYPLKTLILDTADNYCIFESKKDDSEFKLSDTLWIKK